MRRVKTCVLEAPVIEDKTLALGILKIELAIVSAREIRNRPIPSPVVLDRLRDRHIPYARTDQNGAVTVRIDQDGRIELSTYLN